MSGYKAQYSGFSRVSDGVHIQDTHRPHVVRVAEPNQGHKCKTQSVEPILAKLLLHGRISNGSKQRKR